MQFLKRVIGLVTDIILGVLPAPQIPGILIGGNSNTAEHQLQPATQESKPKRKRVQADTRESSPKAKILRVQTPTKKSKVTGTQQATLAKQPSERKRKTSVAQSITPAKLPSKGRLQLDKPAHGKQSATPASKTRQPAKPKRK